MQNAFDEITLALDTARYVKKAAEKHANAMADLLSGNLRAVGRFRLTALKKELEKFNMQTGRWKT